MEFAPPGESRLSRTNGQRASKADPSLASGALPPIKVSQVALNATGKIICGDHNWPGNRPAELPQNVWHNANGQRRNDVLFGDNHVDFFQFPKTVESDPGYATGYTGFPGII